MKRLILGLSIFVLGSLFFYLGFSQEGDHFISFPLITNQSSLDREPSELTLTPITTPIDPPAATNTVVPNATATELSSTIPTRTVDPTEVATALPTDTNPGTPTPTPTSTPTATATATPTVTPSPTATPTAGNYRLTYTIDASSLPVMNHSTLTLSVFVGEIDEATVEAGGETISHSYNGETGRLFFNIDIDQNGFTIDVINGRKVAGFGNVSKSPLKDNRAWAYSHGFDDNVYIEEGISVIKGYGWPGTIYAIGEIIDDNRQEDWITDAPDLYQHLADGWALGSHSWESQCDDASEASITRSTDRLEEIVANSSRTNYIINSFAAPCFESEYHPIILQMRAENETTILFNESGSDYLIYLDGNENFSAGGNTAVPFDFNNPIGRDSSFEVLDVDAVKSTFDWMSQHADESHHFWYNTFAHGDKETLLDEAFGYLHNTYGPGGTDEVWVATAEEIYGYKVMADRVGVTLAGVDRMTE